MMLKEISFRHMQNSNTILYLLSSSTLLAKDLKNAGYNRNTKKKEEEVFEEYCICTEPMDGLKLSLKQLSCGHQFHTFCID